MNNNSLMVHLALYKNIHLAFFEVCSSKTQRAVFKYQQCCYKMLLGILRKTKESKKVASSFLTDGILIELWTLLSATFSFNYIQQATYKTEQAGQ